ncbi:MAG: peptidylprolyl isomerase [Planctomycetota bacterium]
MRNISVRLAFLLGIAVSAGACGARGILQSDATHDIALAEDARDLDSVLQFAKSANTNDRIRAARAIGRIQKKDGVAALKELATDLDARVLTETLFAWGLLGGEDLGKPEWVARFQKHSSDVVRAAYAEALGRSGAGENIIICHQMLVTDERANVRGEAALAMWRLYPKRKLQEDAGEKTTSGSLASFAASLANFAVSEQNAEARWKQTYAIATMPAEGVHAPLIHLATDKDATVRLFAIRGLGKRRLDAGNVYIGAMDAAIISALSDKDDRVAAEAALALKNISITANDAKSLEQLYNRAVPFARRAAIRAIASNTESWNFTEARSVLIRSATDPSSWVRGERAAVPLVELVDVITNKSGLSRPAGLTPLGATDFFSDPDAHVRARALESILQISADLSAPLFTKALADPDYKVIAAAVALLPKTKLTNIAELLRNALAHPRGLVRENAADAFVEFYKNAKSIDPLDVAALANSIISARGEDLAESRASVIVALETVELARRKLGIDTINKNDENEKDLQGRIRVAILDALTDPDPTVLAKAKSAQEKLLDPTPMPKIMIPPPPRPAIPGIHVPAFVREPKVQVITNKGSFTIALFPEDAPIHTENYLQLAAQGHYNNTVWHRVEFNFVLQGGDHLGDGTGSRAAWGGCLRDEINKRKFMKGTLGMPKSDVADSGGCQMFITHIPTPHLDGRYTAFGQVTEGLEVLDLIEVGDRIENVKILDAGR